MPARNTFGDQSAAVPLRAMICLKPKADALRRIEPTLPASCTRSRITLATPGCSAGGGARSKTKPMRAGDSSVLTASNKSSEMTIFFAAAPVYAAAASGQYDAAKTPMAGCTPRPSAARTKWSPSAQIRPCLR